MKPWNGVKICQTGIVKAVEENLPLDIHTVCKRQNRCVSISLKLSKRRYKHFLSTKNSNSTYWKLFVIISTNVRFVNDNIVFIFIFMVLWFLFIIEVKILQVHRCSTRWLLGIDHCLWVKKHCPWILYPLRWDFHLMRLPFLS